MDTPRPSSRTNRTRRVPHPVLIGHAASLSQVPPPRATRGLPRAARSVCGARLDGRGHGELRAPLALHLQPETLRVRRVARPSRLPPPPIPPPYRRYSRDMGRGNSREGGGHRTDAYAVPSVPPESGGSVPGPPAPNDPRAPRPPPTGPARGARGVCRGAAARPRRVLCGRHRSRGPVPLPRRARRTRACLSINTLIAMAASQRQRPPSPHTHTHTLTRTHTHGGRGARRRA